MFGPVNKASPNRCRLSIERICRTAVLDPDEETFVAYMASPYIKNRFRARQMFRLHQGLLPSSTTEPPKLTDINNQATELIDSKQTLYGLIYSLGPVELETLKTHVETILTNGFIRSSKSTAGAPMLIAHDWQTLCGSPGPYQTLCFIQLDWSAHHEKNTREKQQFEDSLPDP